MAKINLLSKSVSELIAAGEVVERPASIVKETVENSIDAGSAHITVEIKNGGVSFIRITDDGCGIAPEDVRTAFLRHATSKIKTEDDLNAISTLGFRGEALAAISSVCKIEMLTKVRENEFGTHFECEGGTETVFEETGCPDGTTLIIRDVFFNTPARMKFLKKDVTEGTAISALVERIAISHPEIAFKLIREGKQVFSTAGNGDLGGTVYSVFGREFHQGLIPVGGDAGGVMVNGFTCKPVFCRASRAYQLTYLNGRLVISKTVMAAAEQAYKNCSMVGKFPGFVLFITVPPEVVDVNVHPAKTEVRFSDERRIFNAVYYAVKNAITLGDTRPTINPAPKKKDNFMRLTAEQYRQTAVIMPEAKPSEPTVLCDSAPEFIKRDIENYLNNTAQPTKPKIDVNISADKPYVINEKDIYIKRVEYKPESTNTEIQKKPQEALKSEPQEPEKSPEKEYTPEAEVRYVGEAFSTYIIVERGEELYLIDKHAAHERIIFNELKKNTEISGQELLVPITLKLPESEHTALVGNAAALLKAGFEVEDFGGSVIVRTVPAALSEKDVESVLLQCAESLKNGGKLTVEALDNLFHTVACKAAIKAGYVTSKEEQLSLAIKVLSNNDVMYCPHGRPTAFIIKRNELHKYFGRIQ